MWCFWPLIWALPPTPGFNRARCCSSRGLPTAEGRFRPLSREKKRAPRPPAKTSSMTPRQQQPPPPAGVTSAFPARGEGRGAEVTRCRRAPARRTVSSRRGEMAAPGAPVTVTVTYSKSRGSGRGLGGSRLPPSRAEGRFPRRERAGRSPALRRPPPGPAFPAAPAGLASERQPLGCPGTARGRGGRGGTARPPLSLVFDPLEVSLLRWPRLPTVPLGLDLLSRSNRRGGGEIKINGFFHGHKVIKVSARG